MAVIIDIELSWSEVWQSVLVGALREIQNMKRERDQNHHGATEHNEWQRHIVAAHCELAVAKHLNVFWSGSLGNLGASDVAGFYEVRGTTHANGRLRVHPPDKDDKPYIHARLIGRKVELVGWLYAREAKQKEFWTDPQRGRFAFFPPNDVLHDMATLPPVVSE